MGKNYNSSRLVNGLSVDASGNVGVGNSPNASYKLAVTGASLFSSSVTAGGNIISQGPYIDLQNTSYIRFSNSGGGTRWGYIQHDGTNIAFKNDISGGNFNFTGGNVGIGTSSPGAILDVVTTGSVNATFNSTATEGGYVRFQRSGTNFGFIGQSYHIVTGGSVGDMAVAATANLVFSSGASLTERMRITSSGLVLINKTTAAGYNLEVNGSGYFDKSDGTYVAYAHSGNVVGYVGTANQVVSGGSTGNMGINATNSLIFSTGSGSPERMRITSGGLVGIGNSGISQVRLAISYGGGGTPLVGIGIQDVDNASNSQYMQFLNAATTAIGSITRNGGLNQINYNTSSDYRLKEDFKDFNGLEKVTAIKVYDHKWVGFEDRTTSVIAHELAEILPYAVTGEKDAVDENGNIKPQQVDYSKIVPVLVKAIQELKGENDELRSILTRNNLQ